MSQDPSDLRSELSTAPADAPAGINLETAGAFEERRQNRVDDASTLPDDAAIDPRELDARVRIEEGATVDDEAPVAGVRYEDDDEPTPHRYGQPEDAYGPGHGDGRIGFDRVIGDVAPGGG